MKQKAACVNNNSNTLISWKNFLKIHVFTSINIGKQHLNLAKKMQHFLWHSGSIVPQLFQKIFFGKFFYQTNVLKKVRKFNVLKLFIPYLPFGRGLFGYRQGSDKWRRHLSGYNFSNPNIARKSKNFWANVRGYPYAMSHNNT